MEILIKLDITDWNTFQKHMKQSIVKAAQAQKTVARLRSNIASLLIVAAAVVYFDYFGIHWATAIFSLAIYTYFYALRRAYSTAARRINSPLENGHFFEQRKITFNATGVTTKSKNHQEIVDWAGIRRIERANGLILIFIDTIQCIVLPEHRLKDPDLLYNFISSNHNQD